MRPLPVEQLIADVLFSLLNAAQVKLGRRDARLLIDLSTVALEHARPYLPDELTRQIDQVLGQLRLGQVSAEGQASQRAEPEENDLDRGTGFLMPSWCRCAGQRGPSPVMVSCSAPVAGW